MTVVVQDLIDLAERCEKATGRDRKLDEDIARVVGYKPAPGSSLEGYGHFYIDPNGKYVGAPPQFTGSIDGAKTLLLDWMSAEYCESAAPASSPELRFTRCRIWDWRRGPLAIDPNNEWKAEGNRPLPLNMCSAILRARASIKGTG
jgi:hypothetical protein